VPLVVVVAQTHRAILQMVDQAVVAMDTIHRVFQVMHYPHKDFLVDVELELAPMNQQVVVVEQTELAELPQTQALSRVLVALVNFAH